MKPIAILSDIHSNLHALKEVLRDVQTSGAAQIVFLGDIVGYGPFPSECVEWVRKLGGHCVMGNHDIPIRGLRANGSYDLGRNWQKDGYAAGLVHSAQSLNDEQATWLSRLPFTMTIPGAMVAHGSWDDPQDFNYIEDADSSAPTLAALRHEEFQIGFFGHTHIPAIFAEDATRLEWLDKSRVRVPAGVACAVTVGAVGQSRDETDLRASWVLWHPAEGVVEFRKTDYNRIAAAKAIELAGLPKDSATRLLTLDEERLLF
jgi:predicted phosphodiesterase